jgi:hypothetical protein
MAAKKKFKLTAAEILPLAEGHGACLATDYIVVQGEPVRFMYREEPDHEDDSGWRFLSGLEDDDYMDDADNLGAYDVNTLANYDRAIIPYLNAPIGTNYERVEGKAQFIELPD